MQKYRVETIYENNLKDFVLLCNVLLHGQTIHGLGPEDIVQRVMLQAWEKKGMRVKHNCLPCPDTPGDRCRLPSLCLL